MHNGCLRSCCKDTLFASSVGLCEAIHHLPQLLSVATGLCLFERSLLDVLQEVTEVLDRSCNAIHYDLWVGVANKINGVQLVLLLVLVLLEGLQPYPSSQWQALFTGQLLLQFRATQMRFNGQAPVPLLHRIAASCAL